MIVKVCGMREADNIRRVEALGIDWMGFIFYPRSKRHVAALPPYLPQNARRVGVFVNAPLAEISPKIKDFGLDCVQLHGSETPDFCAEVKKSGVKVIKAVHVSSDADLSALDYPADYLLFETPSEAFGGSGRHFDWSLLNSYSGPVPFLLSGGIGPDDFEAINAMDHPLFAGIDLNSRFESEPGVKQPELLATFLAKLKKPIQHESNQ